MSNCRRVRCAIWVKAAFCAWVIGALLTVPGCSCQVPSQSQPVSNAGTSPKQSDSSPASVGEHKPEVPNRANSSKSEPLLRLIRSRLDVMPAVARAKWNRKLPVADPQRESALLTKLTADAAGLGLPEDLVRRFFTAQIESAKLVQQQLFDEWTARQQPPFEDAPSLEKEIRPQIDKLNQQLLSALADWSKAQSKRDGLHDLPPGEVELVRSSQWSKKVVDTALQPLRETEK